MSTYQILALILLAGGIHASFQLSVSMMMLMSGHALGKRTAHKRVMRLVTAFVFGAMVMTALSVSFLAFVFATLVPSGELPLLAWAAICGLLVGVGVAVWAFYYRHRKAGTVLWIPRQMAEYLSSRARKTKLSGEAFGLGLASVMGEILFGIAPMIVAALLLVQFEAPLAGLLLYVVIATLPLIIIAGAVGGGHSLARIQRWRERNKRFLQFAAGSALIVLGGYLYVDVILAHLTVEAIGVSGG